MNLTDDQELVSLLRAGFPALSKLSKLEIERHGVVLDWSGPGLLSVALREECTRRGVEVIELRPELGTSASVFRTVLLLTMLLVPGD
mgnify:FL=1